MLSRTVKSIITQAIINTNGSTNRYELCYEVSNILIEKYSDINLEYHTSKMKIDTTKKILSAIDEFFYKDYEQKIFEEGE